MKTPISLNKIRKRLGLKPKTSLSKISSLEQLVNFLQKEHNYGLYDLGYENLSLPPYHPDYHCRKVTSEEVLSLLNETPYPDLNVAIFKKLGEKNTRSFAIISPDIHFCNESEHGYEPPVDPDYSYHKNILIPGCYPKIRASLLIVDFTSTPDPRKIFNEDGFLNTKGEYGWCWKIGGSWRITTHPYGGGMGGAYRYECEPFTVDTRLSKGREAYKSKGPGTEHGCHIPKYEYGNGVKKLLAKKPLIQHPYIKH
ncbi:MAG: hypothetical protein NTW30_02650 [Candidatus Aenigmarchaeota archaeon]|nr:hypothetical protein [Candidatus Aenigmarchaeota archaeon]